MGAGTDADICAWQEHAGLILPSADELEIIKEMKDLAFRLIQCLVLEESGICDGAGYWVCSDPIAGIISMLNEIRN